MGPIILYSNVHTGPRQEQELEPLSPIVPVPFPVPVLVTVPCSVNKPLVTVAFPVPVPFSCIVNKPLDPSGPHHLGEFVCC